MDIQEGTFVIALPYKEIKAPCKGVVETVLEGGMLKVITEKETYYVPDRTVIPLFKTEAKNPKEIDNTRLLAWIIKNLPYREEVLPNLSKNLLVVVAPKQGKPPQACWGLIKQKTTGGNYDVRVGFKKSLFAAPDQIIPVIETDGSFRGPHAAVRKELDKIILQLLLQLRIYDKRHSLSFLIKALESLQKA